MFAFPIYKSFGFVYIDIRIVTLKRYGENGIGNETKIRLLRLYRCCLFFLFASFRLVLPIARLTGMTKRLCSALLALSTAVMCLCACTAGGQVSASGAPPSGSSSAPAPSSVSQSAQEPQPQPEPETPAIVTDPSANPLTGLAKADDWPEGMRPLAVMLDNVQAALPQRGLQSADLVYEMVTEGGITRLMAVYSDYTSMPEVGPVRSARDQHVQLMFPLGAMYLHVGGSTYAKALLSQYHYEAKSLDGYFQAGALELDAQRNLTAAIEHCWFTSGELFSQAAAQYRLDTEMDDPQQAVFQFFVPLRSGAPCWRVGKRPSSISVFPAMPTARSATMQRKRNM